MDLDSILFSRKKELVNRWFDILIASYPPETAAMLRKESNQFANPVGHTFVHALGEIVDEFLRENREEKILPALDRILRIRAVQDFAPSSALAFLFLLKGLVREVLREEIEQATVDAGQLSDFDDRVDGLALAAMDVYASCRNTLYEVRIREIKDRTYRLLQRAELVADVRPDKPAGEPQ